MVYSNLSKIDLFGDLKTSNDMVNSKEVFEDMIHNYHEHYALFCSPEILSFTMEPTHEPQNKA